MLAEISVAELVFVYSSFWEFHSNAMWLEVQYLIHCFSPGAGVCTEAATRTGCISEENYSAAKDRTRHY